MTESYIQENVPLRDLTTFKIGGTARYFCSVDTEQKLKEAVRFAKEKNVQVVILGGGSNVLISDEGINALVLKIDIRGITWDSSQTAVTAGAGENWDGLVAETVSRGLWGIENLSGIPGTVGAAPVQNIGAYGTELKDTLAWVEVFDVMDGAVRKLSREACRFGYRNSVFKYSGKHLVILRVALQLKKEGSPNLSYKDLKEYFKSWKEVAPTLVEIRTAVLRIRAEKFPDLKKFGTAGSFFKNPIISLDHFNQLKKQYPDLPGFEIRGTGENETNTEPTRNIKVSLAWILDNICGLKGFEKGGVALFERQPMVLVASEGASSEEITRFAQKVSAQVKEKTGIDIEWEIQRLQ